MDNIISTLQSIVERNATDEELSEISSKCSSELGSTLINLQTLGYLLYAANQPEEQNEMDDYHNSMAGCLIEQMANDAQALKLLHNNVEFTLKQRQEVNHVPRKA